MPAPTALSWPDTPILRLEFLSDWHVGSGTGRPGNVDRLVTRDASGLPYVPAKTLTGIWRDACVERIWEGTSEIQRHIISRALLRPFGA